jgi:hypothetical protein
MGEMEESLFARGTIDGQRHGQRLGPQMSGPGAANGTF